MQSRLDSTDIRILELLQEDGRMTIRQIAQKVNLSTTPVFERVKRLENEGFIKKYAAILDPEKLDRGFLVFCSVKLKQMSREDALDFASVVKGIPQVAECYNISGDYDYMLKINAPDMKYYNDFIINTLGTIKSIGSITSTFVMKEIKSEPGLYLESRHD